MTPKTRIVRWLSLGLLALAAGCSTGSSLNIGNDQTPGAVAGSWDGYAEAYTFPPSSSDRVRLVLDAQGKGTIQVGSDPILPAPTDPNVGYPPGDEDQDQVQPTLIGGSLYPLYGTQVTANRVQAGLKLYDYYAAWCALQTPYLFHDGYAVNDAGVLSPYDLLICVPTLNFQQGDQANECLLMLDPPDGGPQVQQTVDCGKFILCGSRVCACTQTSCTSAPSLAAGTAYNEYPAWLDLTADSSGQTMSGTLSLNQLDALNGNQPPTRVTIHLTRQ